MSSASRRLKKEKLGGRAGVGGGEVVLSLPKEARVPREVLRQGG